MAGWLDPHESVAVALTVNGAPREVRVPPRRTLADALRSEGFTSVHLGCEHGVCGACTVLVDGAPVRACLMLAVQGRGHLVETVESLGGRANRRAIPPNAGEAVARAARERSEQERETPPLDPMRSHQSALAESDGDELGPLQQAFDDNDALQCGYCTPGFLMLIEGLMRLEPDATGQRVLEAVSSNLCRCTGALGIVQAALDFQNARREAP